MDVAHPLEVCLGVILRRECDLALFYCLNRAIGQRLNLDEPLSGKPGLHNGFAAVALADGVSVIFRAHQQTAGVQVVQNLFAGLEAIMTGIGPGILVHQALLIHDRDLRELVTQSNELRDRLHGSAATMRAGLESAGFTLKPGQHPIVPVMLGDAARAAALAEQLLAKGIYVIGFSYPVVPQGQARIRIQLSAAHTAEQLDRAVRAFTEVGRGLHIVR